MAMSALVPTSKDFLNIQVFSPFANHYGLNEELLKCELLFSPTSIGRKIRSWIQC